MGTLGSPLFILREKCQEDLFAVLEKLSEIGFDGVEFLSFFGRKPENIRRVLDSCGLAAIGDHVPFAEFATETERVIFEHKEIGCKYITISGPGGSPDGDDYARTIETIERIGESMNKAGLTLLYHNHAEELRSLADGRTILEHLMDDTRSDLLVLEPDLGWMRIAGAEPVHYLSKYKNRCPVVHFKDYIPADNERGFIFRPTGYGAMNNAELYAMTLTHTPQPQWYIMDHDDAYDRDIYNDLSISLEYFRNLMAVAK